MLSNLAYQDLTGNSVGVLE